MDRSTISVTQGGKSNEIEPAHDEEAGFEGKSLAGKNYWKVRLWLTEV